jgi:hypothetical protein
MQSLKEKNNYANNQIVENMTKFLSFDKCSEELCTSLEISDEQLQDIKLKSNNVNPATVAEAAAALLDKLILSLNKSSEELLSGKDYTTFKKISTLIQEKINVQKKMNEEKHEKKTPSNSHGGKKLKKSTKNKLRKKKSKKTKKKIKTKKKQIKKIKTSNKINKSRPFPFQDVDEIVPEDSIRSSLKSLATIIVDVDGKEYNAEGNEVVEFEQEQKQESNVEVESTTPGTPSSMITITLSQEMNTPISGISTPSMGNHVSEVQFWNCNGYMCTKIWDSQNNVWAYTPVLFNGNPMAATIGMPIAPMLK